VLCGNYILLKKSVNKKRASVSIKPPFIWGAYAFIIEERAAFVKERGKAKLPFAKKRKKCYRGNFRYIRKLEKRKTKTAID
jgi:hypothetical protein